MLFYSFTLSAVLIRPHHSNRQGKNKLILRSEALYTSKHAQMDRIVDAGQRLLVVIHGFKDDGTLNDLGFQLFTKSLVKDNFNFASLTPKAGSCTPALLKNTVDSQYKVDTLKFAYFFRITPEMDFLRILNM
ncbi:hypothetical protein AVEN_275445-1 [Araneus ventricosus]|uniref:Uncharacterized protein n=1 Tax=Araneus ventricosus TaxID=182803 RepID=A0A4Y2IVM9_ARAVE|nr:hypothetical protein AVEN_275445-1 [Araneus ventricosus]